MNENEIDDAVIVDDKIASGYQPINKSLANRVKAMKAGNFSTGVMEKTKYGIRGGVVGGVAGLCTALYYKKSYLIFIVAGGAIGAFIGNILYNSLEYNRIKKESLTKNTEKS